MNSVKMTLELDLEVFFDFQPRESATWHCPGSPAQFEINSIEIAGVEAGPELFEMLMEDYGDEILESCRDKLEGTL